MNDLDRLASQLDEIETWLDRDGLETRVERVSGWSIGEQLDHMTQVLAGALTRLGTSGEPLGRGINLTGRILLGLGWLPRGVGKSPRSVLPSGASAEDLRDRLANLRMRLTELTAQRELLADRRPTLPTPTSGASTRRGRFGSWSSIPITTSRSSATSNGPPLPRRIPG